MMKSSTCGRFGAFVAVIDRLTALGGVLGALSLLGILVLIASEIFARNILGRSMHFSWDLAGYLMGACFLLTSASALKDGSHVRVTALLEVLPPSVTRFVECSACLLGIAICAALSWALIDMAWLSFSRGTTAATSFRVPLVWPQAALAIGSCLLTLQCVGQFLRLFRGEKLAVGQGIE